MKKIVVLSIAFITITNCFSQNVAINNSGAVAHSSALLDVSSNSKGFLSPRMTTAQRTAIITPAEGLFVYDKDTKGFWYYSNNAWSEIPKMTNGGTPTGPAGGDLSGNYPLPNVVRIQNHDVAAGIPGNKQVMKWDNLNNRWQGENDSLFLPYNASVNSPSRLFSIINPSVSDNTGAIFGRSGAGSGSIPATPCGVWGDNSGGIGVLGTSNNYIGVEGVSFQNHGVYGISNSSSFAGVYGTSASSGGAGVMGEISLNGTAVYGLSTGSFGFAGKFVNNNSNNNNEAVSITTNGSGRALLANISNTNNTADAVRISTNGLGSGLYVNLSNSTNSNPAAFLASSGLGAALSANIFNVNSIASAAYIYTNGVGNALYVNNSNANNSVAAVYGNSNGVKGVEGVANGTGVFGRTLLSNSGVGVQGQSLQSDINGIGVKGISNSTNFTSGAVTGINQANGVAVYGESTGGGVAVYGRTTKPNGAAIYGINDAFNGQAIRGSATGTDGVAIYGEAGISSSNSYAGYFRNSNAANSRNVVQVDNLGTGNFLSLTNGLGDVKTAIAKSGNITTDGTVTVKTNKGIVRNTSSAQLRYEVIPAAISATLPANEYMEHTISFPNPFSSPPAVCVGNLLNQAIMANYVFCSIVSVTTTDCKFIIRNISNYGLGINATWNLIAIGPE